MLSKRGSGASAVPGAGTGSEWPLEESSVCWQVRYDDMYVVSTVSTIPAGTVVEEVSKLRKQKASATFTFRATTILKQQVPDNFVKERLSHESVVVYHLPLAFLAPASLLLFSLCRHINCDLYRYGINIQPNER